MTRASRRLPVARFVLPLMAVLSVASLAQADEKNISGRYLDVEGDPIELRQKGSTIEIEPDASGHDMPAQVREMLSDVVLKGPIELQGKGFALDAKFDRTMEPAPGVSLNLKLSLEADGAQTEKGLHMKSCEWTIAMVVFAQGEIAASENKTQKCVGLWKKQ